MNTEFELFNGKNLSSLFEDIYNNSIKNRDQLKVLLSEVAKFINNVDTAKLMVPVLKEYLEINIKNDDQLVKLASIVQKLITGESRGSDTGVGLSSDEKKQLLQTVNNTVKGLQQTADELNHDIKSVKTKTKKVLLD